MTTMTHPKGFDPSIETSQTFARVYQAYKECSTEVQSVVLEMIEIVNSAESTEDERHMACATIAEALFPSKQDGHLGADLEQVEFGCGRSDEIRTEMQRQQEHFTERVGALLQEHKMTQADLAAAIGVGQSAVSMLLSRRCRPQRRTVERIANALRVSVSDLWPEGEQSNE